MLKRIYYFLTSLVFFFSFSASLTAFGDDEIQEIFDSYKQKFPPRPAPPSVKKRKAPHPKPEGEICVLCESSKLNNNLSDLNNISKVADRNRECIGCHRYTVQKKGKIEIIPNPKDLWAEYPEVYEYSNSAITEEMINAALEDSYWVLDKYSRRRLRKRPPTPSTGNCLRHVKFALQKSYLKPKYLAGSRVNRPRKDAIKKLNEVGFVNLLETPPYDKLISDPARAPKGSVLIYEGGSNGGHIEIKTDWGTMGTYVSDHQAKNSIMQNELNGRAGRSYKLIGVMIKPGG